MIRPAAPVDITPGVPVLVDSSVLMDVFTEEPV